jgi:hypothetical protein
MLAEIARKRDEQERERAEAERRATESDPLGARGAPHVGENPPLS